VSVLLLWRLTVVVIAWRLKRRKENSVATNIIDAAAALGTLERMVAAVKGHEAQESKFARVLATLQTLARKEDIPLAIVGGLAAIHHGYERFTKDIDIVVRSGNLDVLTRVARTTGSRSSGRTGRVAQIALRRCGDRCRSEGRKPRNDAPVAIPAPDQLGVREGAGYAGIAGWMETKIGSYRVQDRADIVQVIKVTTRRACGKSAST